MEGENQGQEAQVSGLDPAHWDVVKDDQGNVTVSPKQAADGEAGVDVVIGPGSYGPDIVAAEPAPVVSTRPLLALGHVLCQVCKRPTNSEVQKDLVDTPYVINFNNQPRAIICFDCYMHSILHGAFASLPPDQRATNLVGGEGGTLSYAAERASCGEGGAPGTHCGPEGGLGPIRPLPPDAFSDELPRGSANG